MKTITLDNTTYPKIGFGTYRLKGLTCQDAVRYAVACGYRIIDTATYYENFDAIGEVVKELNRSELYIISKVWYDMQAPKNLLQDFNNALKEMGLTYLDAYFLHWPNSKESIEDILGAMQELCNQKRLRHIGLSNVTVNHVKRALEVGVKITWVQVEMHPHFYDKALLEFCKEHAIYVQAWKPLDKGGMKDDPLLIELAKHYNKTPTQLALRWIVQNGCIPLPGSKTPEHIKENFTIFDFELTAQDMATLNARAASGTRTRLTGKHGFLDEFDYSYEECWPQRKKGNPKTVTNTLT